MTSDEQKAQVLYERLQLNNLKVWKTMDQLFLLT